MNKLEQYLQHRCTDCVQINLDRSEQFSILRRELEKELASLSAETSLTTDLLTVDERLLLGLGHRYIPLYDLFQYIRRRMSRFKKQAGSGGEVDFEKKTDLAAQTLRRNLEQRFEQATNRIECVISDCDYLASTDRPWSCRWHLPDFDEREWALRIQAHIEAWKNENRQQAKRGDIAAMLLGAPLLLADLLFLGGAGMTLTWTALSVAGFVGGKSIARLVQKSKAFAAYQTTVRAYQALIRESLESQCEQNMASLPRCHLLMNDPLRESMMFWSSPVKR